MKILKFSAEWCGGCKALAAQLKGTNLPIVDIDVDEDEELTSKYNITNIPVLVFENDEGLELERIVGVTSKEKVIEAYEKFRN